MDQQNSNTQPILPQEPPRQPDSTDSTNTNQPSQTIEPSFSPQSNTQNNQPVVNQVTGPQINSPEILQPQATTKTKPPIAAQILYALGFLGLIGGLLISLIAFASSNETSSIVLFGLSSLDVKLAAIIFAVIVIGSFAIINFIRGGKKWALISYTTLVVIGIVSSLINYLTMSEFEKRFSNSNPIADLIGFTLIITILVVLWTKNREYFK